MTHKIAVAGASGRMGQMLIDAIRAAGGQPKYTELVEVGHDSWTPASREPHGVVEWMFAQRKPSLAP